jgi:EAL domain-containing protein (putative c-di-GMP-specific phosphodiesterase class I)
LKTRIARLRGLGFRIAVDDLGAGYAGLSTFALLEPEFVKLDMSLVRDIQGAPTKRSLVKAMIEVCRDLEVSLIAEGVETALERDALAELGCTLMQGYFFARPGPPFPVPTL